MPDTYTIYQDGKTFANERSEKQANSIFNMLKRTFPQTEVKLVKWRPVQGHIILKQHTPKTVMSKNPAFTYHGRNYEDAINKAIHKAKSDAQYPPSQYLMGIKQLQGERAVFNLLIKDELTRSKVPKALIKKLTE